MATVRQPGTTIEWILPGERSKEPGERTIFEIRVLTYDEWKAFMRKVESISRNSIASDVLDAVRRALGVGLVDVKGLKILRPDGSIENFVLERAGTEISATSMAVLMPFKDDLLQAIQSANEFGVNDIKN